MIETLVRLSAFHETTAEGFVRRLIGWDRADFIRFKVLLSLRPKKNSRNYNYR